MHKARWSGGGGGGAQGGRGRTSIPWCVTFLLIPCIHQTRNLWTHHLGGLRVFITKAWLSNHWLLVVNSISSFSLFPRLGGGAEGPNPLILAWFWLGFSGRPNQKPSRSPPPPPSLQPGVISLAYENILIIQEFPIVFGAPSLEHKTKSEYTFSLHHSTKDLPASYPLHPDSDTHDFHAPLVRTCHVATPSHSGNWAIQSRCMLRPSATMPCGKTFLNKVCLSILVAPVLASGLSPDNNWNTIQRL